MAHIIKFYPVNNGDTTQIVLDNGKRILIDFDHIKAGEKKDNAVIDLAKSLRDELSAADKDYFDVVAFTHNDEDHIRNFMDFFYLEYADKYKGKTSDGKDRIKIKELWVPAAIILHEVKKDELSDPFAILRKEAQHRFRIGKGIRVFSKPDKLKNWLEQQGYKLEDRYSMITNAGETARGFTLENDGVEFFCHSPFSKHIDENDTTQSNEASLIFNIRFRTGTKEYNYLHIGDTERFVIEDIVKISKYYRKEDRLKWDILNIPHHCSYLSLSQDKGVKITEPTERVKDLLLYGNRSSYMICSSKEIPNTKDAYTMNCPPYIQARNCYEKHLDEVGGCKFLVTMEESDSLNPQPIELKIANDGISYTSSKKKGINKIINTYPPKAGL